MRQSDHVIGNVLGSGTDTEGGRIFWGNRPCLCLVEDDTGDPEILYRGIHCNPQHPSQLTIWPQKRDRLPRGQASPTDCIHEVGGPLIDIPGSVQGI